ncbi:hypothetical protein KUTeg_014761 [Tegillarca granosa]|uniref:C-type lectin domain-containing protein n=1 Tax=Tegillarca granosa TaxID=220873 RepID=A0ABQ9EWE1_TEGGR|nr:hypothetical protein KUTeg_014761 [Tegillarca granosa]
MYRKHAYHLNIQPTGEIDIREMLAKMDGYLSTENTSCHKKGSRLTDVKTMDELNFLASYAKAKKDGIWLDGNDIKQEGKWIWSYNNEPINLAFWGPGEPNGKRSENCLMILKYGADIWKWNDAPCKNSYYYACQKKMQTPLEKQCITAKYLLYELIKCKQRCNKHRYGFGDGLDGTFKQPLCNIIQMFKTISHNIRKLQHLISHSYYIDRSRKISECSKNITWRLIVIRRGVGLLMLNPWTSLPLGSPGFQYAMDELNFLASYAKAKKGDQLKRMMRFDKDGIWLTGNDIKQEGNWIWSYNNEAINLAYWTLGEPNGKRSANCLMI